MGKERGNKDSALGRKNDLRIINILGSVERVEAEMGYCMKENAKIKTLIVDDEKISRGFFEYMIENSEDYELAGALESAADAQEFVSENEVDLVIMDIVMRDGSNGLDAAERIKKHVADPGHNGYKTPKVIIVTGTVDPKNMKIARQAGVDSFWYKELSEQPLLALMDRTMAGESIFPDKVPRITLGNAPSTEFTDREMDVLRELTTGLSNKQIAAKLGVTDETIKSYIQQMLDKTGYANRTELAVNAVLYGLIAVNN